jgi:succinate dehydrogenase/fumarate reductase-like Fe-S protein
VSPWNAPPFKVFHEVQYNVQNGDFARVMVIPLNLHPFRAIKKKKKKNLHITKSGQMRGCGTSHVVFNQKNQALTTHSKHVQCHGGETNFLNFTILPYTSQLTL